MRIFRLNSRVVNYDWGSTSAIANCLGRPPSGVPEAELWMGAHAKCPSPLQDGVGPRLGKVKPADLGALIAADPSTYLGRSVAAQFGHLPFLFKVLAVERPLSLQAHPGSTQAKIGFAREESKGIALDAFNRNYKDQSHKPELVYGLTRFHTLSGFRTVEECLEVSQAFGCAKGQGGLAKLWSAFSSDVSEKGMETYFRGVFSLSTPELASAIERALLLAQDQGALRGEAATFAPWLIRLANLHPTDPGVLASMLLNVVSLAPGEAMFLPAGNLHAYLDGVALEVMASSDNVLRGGLTSKHVDVDELCDVLVFNSHLPEVQKGISETLGQAGKRTRYVSPAPEFELSLLDLKTSPELELHGPSIWLNLHGEVELQGPDFKLRLKKGEQIFISGSEDSRGLQVAVSGEARVACASLGS